MDQDLIYGSGSNLWIRTGYMDLDQNCGFVSNLWMRIKSVAPVKSQDQVYRSGSGSDIWIRIKSMDPDRIYESGSDLWIRIKSVYPNQIYGSAALFVVSHINHKTAAFETQKGFLYLVCTLYRRKKCKKRYKLFIIIIKN